MLFVTDCGQIPQRCVTANFWKHGAEEVKIGLLLWCVIHLQATSCVLHKAVCVDSAVVDPFDLSFLDFCSVLLELLFELTASCSARMGFSPFTTCGRFDWTATLAGGETTTLSIGSLVGLSVTMT